MNKSLIICDRLMYGALLAMILVLPFSFALIEACQIMMMVGWVSKRFSLWKRNSRMALDRSFGFPSSGMGWPLLAIGLLIFLTIPFSHYPSLSFDKLGTRFLQQVFLMYCVVEIINSRKRLYGVLTMLLLMLFFVSVDVFIQYTWGKSVGRHVSLLFDRVSGPMNHPNDLGTFLVTVLPVVMVLCIILGQTSGQTVWVRVMVSVLFLSLVVALGLTSSRGAWLAFTVSMIALGLSFRRWGLVVFIVLFLAVFLWIFGIHCLNTRIDIYNVPMPRGPVISPTLANPWGLPVQFNAWEVFSDPSGRNGYWETAMRVIKHNLWFGCGYSAYMRTLGNMKVSVQYPHNSLLHITAELGIVGLSLYCWLFAALCLKSVRVLRAISKDRDLYLLGCGISCGILAWLIHSLLDTPWSSLQLSILLWLFIGVLLSLVSVVLNHNGG